MQYRKFIMFLASASLSFAAVDVRSRAILRASFSEAIFLHPSAVSLVYSSRNICDSTKTDRPPGKDISAMSGTAHMLWVLLLLTATCLDLGNAGCALPDNIMHGNVVYQTTNGRDRIPIGDIVRVECDEDYRLDPEEGDGSMTCTEEGWSLRYTCVQTDGSCRRPDNLQNGRLIYQTTNPPTRVPGGYLIRAVCDTSYRLDPEGDQYGITWCTDDGWSKTYTCVLACDPLPPLADGEITQRLDGLVARYSCTTPGYRLDGVRKRRCSEVDGAWVWSGTPPTCHPINCAPLLEDIPNGWSTAENRAYTVKESIGYICNPGYRTTSPSWRVCTAEKGPHGSVGVWDGITPSCEVTTCAGLPRIENGETVTDSVEVGGNGTFQCRSGYSLIGDARLTCLSTGQWNGTVPVCDDGGSYCPVLGAPINGRKEGTRYDRYSHLWFSCNHGYTLIGSEERHCKWDGQWDGQPTKCMGPLDFDDVNQMKSNMKKNVIVDAGPSNGEYGLITPTHQYGVDLYFMFDSSKSVGEKNYAKAKNFAKALVKEIGVTNRSNSLRVGAMYFSSHAVVAFHTFTYQSTAEVVDAINDIPYLGNLGNGTNIAGALDVVLDRMSTAVRVREKSVRTAFLITDGGSTEGGSPGRVAGRIKAAGIDMHCIGVGEDASRQELHDIASDPKSEYLFFLKNYYSFEPLIKAVTNQNIDYSECGVSRYTVPKGAGETEVPAKEGAWPWQVYMEIHPQHSSSYHVCGGTLLRQDIILTAAHCVQNFAYLEASVGITNLAPRPVAYQQRRVERGNVIIHELFNNVTHSHDIALIRLDVPLKLTQYVRPACLPDPQRTNRLLYTRNAFVTGWGYDGILAANEVPEGGFVPVNHLQQLPLPLKSREVCEDSLRNDPEAAWWDETMTCAGYTTKEFGVCVGDFGGPLIKYAISGGKRRWTIIGITSWGRGCAARNELDFFTNVPYFVGWINEKMNFFQNN